MLPAARTADGHQRAGIARYLPILGWLHAYDKSWFAADTVAAISVWALLVPQSLAYATLAGVPVQYGLYTALAALVAYAIFGTSRHVVQGPSASVAAVSAAIVAPLLAPGALGTDQAVPLTAALAITTGLVYICLSILRMGWIANFLSSAVMSGFILGFAIGIIIDQSYKLLGVDKTSGTYWDELVGTIKQIPDTNGTTLAVGAASLAALLLMRRFAPKWPRALLVAVVSILAVKAFDLATDGVAVTGNVPTGMFSVDFPTGVWDQFPTLVAGAFAIIFVGISETLAAGRSMAAKHNNTLDVDQEFAAQGFACAGAGLVGGFVNDGSLSKTSVADAAGQKSQMASVVNAVFVLLTILFLAALFENLPSAALGAVVIDAMLGLIGFKAMTRYWRVNKADFVFFMAAGLGIIFFSITQGIGVGVILSLLLLIARSSRPALRQLGRDPRSETYLDIRRHDDLVTDPHILVTRLDGPLFFADANRFHDDVLAAVTQRQDPLVGVVVDMESVAYTDTDGADILISLAAELRRAGIWFGIARAQSEIEDRWRLAGVFDAIGEHRLFDSVAAAVEADERDSSAGLSTPGATYSEPDPPHASVVVRNPQEPE